MQLLFVGVRSEDADPVLDALRQGGVVARPYFVDSVGGIETIVRQGGGFDVALVAIRGDMVDYAKAMSGLAGSLDAPILAWANDVQSDWLAEAYSSGAWAFALGSYPAQAAHVIRQAAVVRNDQEQLRHAKRAAEEVQHRESTLLAAARDPVAYVHEGMHIRANQAYLDFFEIKDAEEIEGLPLLDLVAPSRAAEVKTMLRSASQGAEVPETMMELQTMEGEGRQARISMSKSVYEGEHCLQIALRPDQDPVPTIAVLELGGYSDMAALIDQKQQNPQGARHCALLLMSVSDGQAFEGLGLANAKLFMSALASRLEKVAQRPMQVFDLDGRTLGAIVEDLPPEGARSWIEEYREEVALHPINTASHSMRPLLSIGGVMLGPDWKDIQQEPFAKVEELWRHARASRTIEWFDPSARDREEDMRRKELLDYTRKALAGNGMLLAYRPILPLTGEHVELFEVFIRMRGPNGDTMRPDDFLGLAEDNGLGTAVDDAAAKLAALSIFEARKQKRDPRILLSIGISSLLDEKFAYRLAGLMDEKQVPRDRIVVQVQESVARAHQGAVERLCAQKKELGFEMVVSRFMGELESYDMLAWSQPQWVKLDESWTRDLPRNEKKQAQLKEMVATLNRKGFASIADFVRDSTTMTILFSAQVGYAAGDFLAPESQVMNAVEQ